MNRRARLLAAAWVCAALVLPAVGAAAEDDPFKAVAGYQVGQSRKPLVAVEDIVRAAMADAAKRAAVERKLLALLASKDATLHCKGFACRQLGLVGSAASVPALAAHLTEDDQQLGFMARFALEQIPDPAALGALRKA
ncbi:hypothetical protein HQ576_19105, partial [bacterium]|nr:hypothetical protein [bacterium]